MWNTTKWKRNSPVHHVPCHVPHITPSNADALFNLEKKSQRPIHYNNSFLGTDRQILDFALLQAGQIPYLRDYGKFGYNEKSWGHIVFGTWKKSNVQGSAVNNINDTVDGILQYWSYWSYSNTNYYTRRDFFFIWKRESSIFYRQISDYLTFPYFLTMIDI